MSDYATAMKGRYDHKMDAKHRVAIPSDWRPAAGEKYQLLLTEREGRPLVAVLTKEEMALRLRQVDEDTELTVGEKREMKGEFLSLCRDAGVNDQGKLLIPKDWSERAELPADGDVVLLGRGGFFEVWSAENLAQIETAVKERLKAANKRLAIM